MQGVNPESYEEAINQLQRVYGELNEDVSVLIRAGEDCVDNTDNDPAAKSVAGKVNECAKKISDAIEQVQAVIQAMQQQLDDTKIAAARAQ